MPGCEDGDAPYSQELIGGGKVNRSFLVRTRRGRFVVRLNENATSDPGLDRARELALHTAAANAGIAPQVVYADPDHSCLITDYVDGRLWTPHYFTRMRDLRSLGQRLRVLQAVPPPPVARFDPHGRRATLCRHRSSRSDPDEAGRIQFLLASGAEAMARAGSSQRAPSIVHSDLHHGNVLTADRVYFIDWEYAQVGDPLLDLACVMTYYPRAMAHGALLLEAVGPRRRRRDARDAGRAHQRVHSADISLVSRAPRFPQRARHRSAARIRRPAPPAFAGARRPTSAH